MRPLSTPPLCKLAIVSLLDFSCAFAYMQNRGCLGTFSLADDISKTSINVSQPFLPLSLYKPILS